MATDVTVNITAQDNFSGVLGNFGSIITGIESAVHLAGDAFRAFAGFALQGLEAIASYERIAASLEALVASQMLMSGAAESMAEALTMSSGKAEELLGWVQELAIKSPFTQEGVAQALRMAMAYGFNVDEAQRLTQALIDFAAGTGAPEEAMSRIALALGQIEAKGKLSGQEILQLVNAGLPVVQILAEAFGKTTAEVTAMVSDGLVPANQAIEAITEYIENNFAGAAERQATTWAGLMGTFEDLKNMGLREFFGGLFDVIQPLAVEFSTWLQGEGMDKLAEWGAILGEFTQNIVDKIPDALAVLEELRTAFETGGLSAVINVVIGDIDAQDIANWLDKFDAQLAVAVDAHNWTASGDSFGNMIADIFSTNIKSQDSKAIPAIAQAIGDWFLAAAGVADWNEFSNTFADILQYYLIELPFSKISTALTTPWIYELAHSIGEGLLVGLNSIDLKANEWFDRVFVQPIKEFLGIASPSTLFMGIGRDIVLGLIVGWVGMFSGFSAIVSGAINGIVGTITGIFTTLWGNLIVIFNKIIDAWNTSGLAGIIALIGGGSLFPGGTGGASGSSDLGGGTPSTGASGTTVNQYFAGATINVGSWDEIIYDCVYPNPFIGSTSGQLTGGGGGGTGAPR
jgi:tape measure domain-containing protein